MSDTMLGIFERLGWTEILIILIVALVLFGGSQLPKLARRLGRGVHEFQEGIKGAKDEFEKGMTGGEKSESEKSKAEKPGDSKPTSEGSDSKDNLPKA